jgi:hypothetical protein
VKKAYFSLIVVDVVQGYNNIMKRKKTELYWKVSNYEKNKWLELEIFSRNEN